MLVLTYFLMGLLGLIGTFLIFIVLLQRGRGGGLAGALGGMGGQSAFGTKAGDMFTRITVVLAIIWIVLCAALIPMSRMVSSRLYTGGRSAGIQEAPATKPGDGEKPPADDNPLTSPVKGETEATDTEAPVEKTDAAEKAAEKSEAAKEPESKPETKTDEAKPEDAKPEEAKPEEKKTDEK